MRMSAYITNNYMTFGLSINRQAVVTFKRMQAVGVITERDEVYAAEFYWKQLHGL